MDAADQRDLPGLAPCATITAMCRCWPAGICGALEIEAVHFTWLWIRDVARTADLQTGDDVTSMDRPCIIGFGNIRNWPTSGLGERFD